MKIDVLIPFLKLHELFPKDVSRDMRDFSHFTQFTKSWTTLHIFQRPCLVISDKSYILSSNYDIYCCLQIFNELIESTRTGTEKRILDFYREFMMGKTDVTFYVSTLTTDYNEVNKCKLSDFTIRKWLNRLNEIGYVDKQPDEHDKRKHVYLPLVTKEEKSENVCDLEKQTKILSVLEKGYKSWRKNICEQTDLILKENIFSEKHLPLCELDERILLDVEKVLTLSENVFKYIEAPKIEHIIENKPKIVCVVEKKGNTNISEPEINNEIANNKPPTCKKCGEIIFQLSDLSNINGAYPYCKTCADEYLRKQKLEEDPKQWAYPLK